MKIFDYIFYKVTKMYFKLDGRTGATGVASVTLVQGFLLCDVFFLLIKIFKVGDLSSYSKAITSIAFLFIMTLFAINFYRYKDRYNKLHFIWKSESELRSTLGDIVVICSIVFPFVLMIFIVNW